MIRRVEWRRKFTPGSHQNDFRDRAAAMARAQRSRGSGGKAKRNIDAQHGARLTETIACRTAPMSKPRSPPSDGTGRQGAARLTGLVGFAGGLAAFLAAKTFARVSGRNVR